MQFISSIYSWLTHNSHGLEYMSKNQMTGTDSTWNILEFIGCLLVFLFSIKLIKIFAKERKYYLQFKNPLLIKALIMFFVSVGFHFLTVALFIYFPIYKLLVISTVFINMTIIVLLVLICKYRGFFIGFFSIIEKNRNLIEKYNSVLKDDSCNLSQDVTKIVKTFNIIKELDDSKN